MANEKRPGAKHERQHPVRGLDKGPSKERLKERQLERGLEHEKLPNGWRSCT